MAALSRCTRLLHSTAHRHHAPPPRQPLHHASQHHTTTTPPPRQTQTIITILALVMGVYDGFYGPGTGTFL
ncbi:MAG: hypothetical protein J6Q33_00945, partial [Alistipes sp.]|nr:hypothetical protein [Alistipes sp.]